MPGDVPVLRLACLWGLCSVELRLQGGLCLHLAEVVPMRQSVQAGAQLAFLHDGQSKLDAGGLYGRRSQLCCEALPCVDISALHARIMLLDSDSAKAAQAQH